MKTAHPPAVRADVRNQAHAAARNQQARAEPRTPSPGALADSFASPAQGNNTSLDTAPSVQTQRGQLMRFVGSQHMQQRPMSAGASRSGASHQASHAHRPASDSEKEELAEAPGYELRRLSHGSGHQGGGESGDERGRDQKTASAGAAFKTSSAVDLPALPGELAVRAFLCSVDAACRAAVDSGAASPQMLALLDSSLREALLMTARAVEQGAPAEPLLRAVREQLRGRYAHHLHHLPPAHERPTTMAFVGTELTTAFSGWRAHASAGERMSAFFVALPAAYLSIRNGKTGDFR